MPMDLLNNLSSLPSPHFANAMTDRVTIASPHCCKPYRSVRTPSASANYFRTDFYASIKQSMMGHANEPQRQGQRAASGKE